MIDAIYILVLTRLEVSLTLYCWSLFVLSGWVTWLHLRYWLKLLQVCSASPLCYLFICLVYHHRQQARYTMDLIDSILSGLHPSCLRWGYFQRASKTKKIQTMELFLKEASILSSKNHPFPRIDQNLVGPYRTWSRKQPANARNLGFGKKKHVTHLLRKSNRGTCLGD